MLLDKNYYNNIFGIYRFSVGCYEYVFTIFSIKPFYTYTPFSQIKLYHLFCIITLFSFVVCMTFLHKVTTTSLLWTSLSLALLSLREYHMKCFLKCTFPFLILPSYSWLLFSFLKIILFQTYHVDMVELVKNDIFLHGLSSLIIYFCPAQIHTVTLSPAYWLQTCSVGDHYNILCY